VRRPNLTHITPPRLRYLRMRRMIIGAWAVALLCGYLIYAALCLTTSNRQVQWLFLVATVLLSVVAGKRAQAWLQNRLDPTGDAVRAAQDHTE
jgi:hypothetical protein